MTAVALDDFIKKSLDKVASYELVQIGQKSVGLIEEYAGEEWRDKGDELITTIMGRAHQDSAALGGLNRYALLAHFDGKRTLRCAFRAQGDEDGIGGESEPANAEGLAAQAMRHAEALMRQCVSLTMSVAGHQNELIARQSEQITRMSEKHFEAIKTIEELLSEKALRDIELKREDRKIELQQQFVREGMPLAKVVGAKLLTGNKIPAEKSPQVEALKMWVHNLEPAKFQQILGALSPVEQAGLLEIMTSLTADEQKGDGSNGQAHDGPPAGTGFH